MYILTKQKSTQIRHRRYWRNAALRKRNKLNSEQVAAGRRGLHATAVTGSTMLGNEESRENNKTRKAQRGEEEGNLRAEKQLN